MSNFEKMLGSVKEVSSMWLKVRKPFTRVFFFVIVSFFMLSTYNVNAEDQQLFKQEDVFGNQDSMNEAMVGNNGSSITTLTRNTAVVYGLIAGETMNAPMFTDNTKLGAMDPVSRYGVLGMVDNSSRSMLQNMPTIDVPEHLAQDWVPGRKDNVYSTYAASGYSYLSDLKISSIWEKTRGIAYVIFMVVLIIAGFMIMFRQKIGGQVAITVYNTIPNVIIGLVLVTFSFAIVGLILDIGVLLMNLIMSIFGLDPAKYLYLGTLMGPGSVLDGAIRSSNDAQLIGQNSLSVAVYDAVAGGATLATNGAGVFAGAVASVFAALPSLILAIIVLALFIYAGIKVFITVFKAFLGIIFDTILAPLVLTLAVIPGNENMRKDWFNRVLKNTLVFPVVFFLVNLPGFLNLSSITLDPSGLGNATLVVSHGNTGVEALIRGLLPLFLYFIAAEAPKYLNDFFPSNSPKGMAEAMQGLKKMPIVGSFL